MTNINSTSEDKNPALVVIGGGYAGIASAVQLASEGHAIRWVETPSVSGMSADGKEIDDCQHTLLRACIHALDLYEKLEVLSEMKWYQRIQLDVQGHESTPLVVDDLPTPFHLLRGIIGLKSYSYTERFALMRGFWAITQVPTENLDALAVESFADWLKAHGQDQEMIDGPWTALLSLVSPQHPADISASYGVFAFQQGYLINDRAGQVGIFSMNHPELRGKAEELVLKAGGKVEQASVAELKWNDNHMGPVVLDSGEAIDPEAVILALPYRRMLQLVQASGLDKVDNRFEVLARLESRPIIGVHVFVQHDHIAEMEETASLRLLSKGVIGHFADRGVVALGPNQGCRHIHVTLSTYASEQYASDTNETIIEVVWKALQTLEKGFIGATLAAAEVLREERARSAPRPGNAHRIAPDSVGELTNLFIAGDWCSEMWPTTVEGAVRSGYSAAACMLQFIESGAVVDPRANHLLPLEPSAVYDMLSC